MKFIIEIYIRPVNTYHWNLIIICPTDATKACVRKQNISVWGVCSHGVKSLLNFIFCRPCIKYWFLVNDQREAQFFSMYLILFLTLYIFIQLLVAVSLCRWPCCVQVGTELPTCTRHDHRHRMTATRGCIDTICLSWRWARCARNM